MAHKFEQTDTLFAMKLSKKREKVYPFNAEVEKFRCPKTDTLRNSISWSHGFTHLKREDGSYAGFCGTNWFEENARPVKTKP